MRKCHGGIALCPYKMGNEAETPYRHTFMPSKEGSKEERKVRYSL